VATFDVDTDARTISFLDAPVDGVVELDVAQDIYSTLKDQWRTTEDLHKLRFPFEPVGGNLVSATERIGRYVFLSNDTGWRLLPYDADHTLKLIGNIFPISPDYPMWLSQPTRTIVVQVERSAQALLSVETIEVEPPYVGPTDDERAAEQLAALLAHLTSM
jgi:hypothetical protein